MSYRTLTAGALGAAAIVFGVSPALSHVFVGSRFFPATLTIDDPGVNDELALPTFAYLANPDIILDDGTHQGSRQYNYSFEYSKRITPDFGISIEDSYTRLTPLGSGWQNLETSLKYQLFINAEHEFILSLGVGFEWGHTGNATVGAEPFTSWEPQIFFGKGAGDLPTELDIFRPFAVTGQMGVALSTHPINVSVSFDPETRLNTVDIERSPTALNWGFSLQYSLPYMNSNVLAIDNEFLKHLIPLVEVSFSTPIANIGPTGSGNSHVTIGTINPGVIYSARYFQIGIEALIPVNADSGKHVGAIAQLHFYLDDIFPDSLGKPLFAPEGFVSARSPF
ncbi:hypothetical protein [Methylocapsa aurea]|uniref:hypothetical protein n=1 Tax=Methylocapsa aurea TaxID=663610 RepID=UPI000560B939|nr:hypothetical protein [Methylocapsa aurea]